VTYDNDDIMTYIRSEKKFHVFVLLRFINLNSKNCLKVSSYEALQLHQSFKNVDLELV